MPIDNKLRIIVGNAPGSRSDRWDVMTDGDDIYVQHHGMRKDLKISLHESGKGHVAFTDGGTERWKPDGDRYVTKWGEPEDFAPGGKALLGIVIPTDHLQVPDPEPPLAEREKPTLLVDPAPAGKATFLSIVLTPPGTQLTAPQGRTLGATRAVGSAKPRHGLDRRLARGMGRIPRRGRSRAAAHARPA